jgi:hypothetical protein
MVDLLTNVGEEWLVENNIDGATITVGLYEDATDTLGEPATLSDITTEPAGAAYSRQTDTVTTAQIGGDFGADNDSTVTFDTSDSSQTVDAAFIVVNFQSDTVAGDGSAQDNLVAAGDLTQSRDLSNVSSVDIATGDLEITLN